jgi:proline iminopeptidase
MRLRSVLGHLVTALLATWPWQAGAFQGADSSEVRIPVGRAALHVRTIGRGLPLIVLHGGPSFDYGYLLPELDAYANRFQLIYYDQRGRGRSAEHVAPEDVTLASDVEDIDRVRRHFQLARPAILAHSWGALLALEYARRNPTRVSQLILMNPAPVSVKDVAMLQASLLEKLGVEMARIRTIIASPEFQSGDPEAVAERYRIHFKAGLARAEDHEKLMTRMKAGFLRQGADGIVKARAIDGRLKRDTWDVPAYDLLPALQNVHVPTLVIAGDRDFIPVEVAEHIARTIPNATFVIIKGCGHFAYLECPEQTRSAIDAFFRNAGQPRQRR